MENKTQKTKSTKKKLKIFEKKNLLKLKQKNKLTSNKDHYDVKGGVLPRSTKDHLN